MFRSFELIEKLHETYNKYNQIIIAYDFDDTVREWNPETPYEGVVGRHEDVVKLLQKAKKKLNGAKFICYTARNVNDPQTIEYITKFCTENDIPLDTINKDVIDWYGAPSKLFYNIFLDDKAGLETAFYVLDRFIDEATKPEIIKDGTYFGIWGGYIMDIYDSKMQYVGSRPTVEGVRGFDIKYVVRISNDKIADFKDI